MKKYTIKYILFPLLLAAMAGCTEDPIPVAAGKLPDETTMNNTGGMLYSQKSLTNKLVIRLSKDEASGTDAIYYTLTKPAATAVTVTAIADEKLVDTYNKTNQTKLKALPAANVQFEGGGKLTVATGKQTSDKIKITISTQGLEAETVYLLPLTIKEAPTGVQAQSEKQVLYYGVSIREKITTIYPYDLSMPTAMPPISPDVFAVFYVNTENYQPLIADVYGINKMNSDDFSETLYTIGDIVNLRIVTVDYNSATKRALLNLSSDLRYVLENADKYIRRLQEHGRKVCICIEGGGKGLGFCNMNDAQIADFSNQVKDVIELHQLDGVNLWDRDSGYGKAGMPATNTTSYPKLIKALHKALSDDKLLTLVDKGEPTEYFYDGNACGGIEVGKYIDYAWHGYVSEEEEVQIINPWESGQSYSKYIRKPIAGLAPEYYGNVNIPRYPGSASQLGDDTSKKLIKWREEERDNNILVFGNDLTANEQNQYEGAILGMITQVDFFMIDGGKIEMKPWGMEGYTPGDYMYEARNLYYMLQQKYKVYAKDW